MAKPRSNGATSFGNACVIAKHVIAANQGTRYIEITLGGWDMHQNIYTPTQLPALAKQLDDGLSQLIADLTASGDFANTMIVMAGEFGRTTGPLTAAAGRDHYAQQFAFFAGAGVTGGKAIRFDKFDWFRYCRLRLVSAAGREAGRH
jgi:uncharacterized protein (DUF1501 family)